MKSDDIYNLQDEMTDIMTSGNVNQTMNVRNQEYVWVGNKKGGWAKATWNKNRNKYTYKRMKATGLPERSFPTIRKVFDQHGIPVQGKLKPQ